jgi:hypothetical protein
MENSEYLQLTEYLKGNLSVETGIALFIKYSPKRQLIRNVLSRRSEKMIKLMNIELAKIEKNQAQSQEKNTPKPIQPQEVETPISEKSPAPIREDHNVITKPDFVSRSLKESILEARKKLYRERGHLHGRLHEANNDQDRYVLARSLHDVQAKINQVNQDLRKVENGDPPTTYILNELDPAIYFRLRNVKQYISRYEKKVAGAKSIKERNRAQSHLDKYNHELKTILNGNS